MQRNPEDIAEIDIPNDYFIHVITHDNKNMILKVSEMLNNG